MMLHLLELNNEKLLFRIRASGSGGYIVLRCILKAWKSPVWKWNQIQEKRFWILENLWFYLKPSNVMNRHQSNWQMYDKRNASGPIIEILSNMLNLQKWSSWKLQCDNCIRMQKMIYCDAMMKYCKTMLIFVNNVTLVWKPSELQF